MLKGGKRSIWALLLALSCFSSSFSARCFAASEQQPRRPDDFRGSSLPCPLRRGFSLFACGGSGGFVRGFIFLYVNFMGARFSLLLCPLVTRGGIATPFPLVRCVRGGAVSPFFAPLVKLAPGFSAASGSSVSLTRSGPIYSGSWPGWYPRNGGG